jgi:hypothetical protein
LFFVTIPVFLQIPSCSRGSDKFSFCENLDLRTHYIERYGAGKKSFHHYLYASNYKEECFDQYEFVKHLITYSDTVKQAQPVSGITVCIDNINFTQRSSSFHREHPGRQLFRKFPASRDHPLCFLSVTPQPEVSGLPATARANPPHNPPQALVWFGSPAADQDLFPPVFEISSPRNTPCTAPPDWVSFIRQTAFGSLPSTAQALIPTARSLTKPLLTPLARPLLQIAVGSPSSRRQALRAEQPPGQCPGRDQRPQAASAGCWDEPGALF